MKIEDVELKRILAPNGLHPPSQQARWLSMLCVSAAYEYATRTHLIDVHRLNRVARECNIMGVAITRHHAVIRRIIYHLATSESLEALNIQ
ncbi:hypothetical protein OUZ56_001435 [Daphnia magna]|uniref:Uncharacterized protein n=1 Tax=Daphnia magna TaxID=35525 RepID=A0ABR0A2N2_9CRUS|nr:hypothetical protein OUZ56_001435 [Daphnia magna]